MTQEENREPVKKTPADHLTNTLAQLKEMRHYSKTNVEHLTSLWMLFDGDLSKLKRTDKIEDLMNRQGQLHDALEAVIADLEVELPKLQPAPDAAVGQEGASADSPSAAEAAAGREKSPGTVAGAAKAKSAESGRPNKSRDRAKRAAR
jgi:hypothetical protein